MQVDSYAGGEDPATVSAALHHYARQLGRGRAVTRYPRFRRVLPAPDEAFEMAPEVGAAIMAAIEAEAENQDVALELLVEHALMVYLADVHAQRI